MTSYKKEFVILLILFTFMTACFIDRDRQAKRLRHELQLSYEHMVLMYAEKKELETEIEDLELKRYKKEKLNNEKRD